MPWNSIWFDIDLTTIDQYEIWKPDSLAWGSNVNWAKINDLVRDHLDDFPPNDPYSVRRNAEALAPDLTEADHEGLFSLWRESIFATTFQITNGGHRITAMRAQGVRFALGQCQPEDIGEGVDPSVAYPPAE